jgi:hypothetical protein
MYNLFMDEITVIIDWDFETFYVLDNLDIVIYDSDVKSDSPESIYIEGWPLPGWSLDKTIAHRVSDFTYRLDPSDEKTKKLLAVYQSPTVAPDRGIQS